MSDAYEELIARKERYAPAVGFDVAVEDDYLFPFQRHAVRWALAGGRRALFEDTGLGKSRQQLTWAHYVCEHTGGRVLILAPLAVGPQTVREAVKCGIPGVVFAKTLAAAGDARIVVTNYDSLDKFADFEAAGVVLDESSILKSFMGATKIALCERFARTPFRLACTATPAPNDHLELGNHAEFLGILSSHQMIARWFINDTTKMGVYRLKGHAVRSFWDWVASWAVCAGKPSDLGNYEDGGYVLPPLNLHRHVINLDIVTGASDGNLFRLADLSATNVHAEKRRTRAARVADCAAIVKGEWAEATGATPEPWLIFCDMNDEQDALETAFGDAAFSVRGADSNDNKEDRIFRWLNGERPVMISKASLIGFGMNFQHCAKMAFVGGTYSYEAFYQAVRRCYRFGQTREVDAHVFMAYTEQALWEVVTGKSMDHESMKREMFAAARRSQARHSAMRDYHPTCHGRLPAWLVSSHPEPTELQCSA